MRFVLALSLLTGVAAGFGGMASAQTAVCSSTPASGERIDCNEDAQSDSDIDIDAAGLDIDATDHPGVRTRHYGAGDIDVEITGDGAARSTVDVTGTSDGKIGAVVLRHEGTGDAGIRIGSTDIDNRIVSTDIDNPIGTGKGVSAEHHGQGNLRVVIDDGTEIDSTAQGVIGVKQGAGDLEVRVQGRSRVSSGSLYGVYGINSVSEGAYDSVVIVKDSTVTAMGTSGHAIRGVRERGSGTSRVSVRGSTVTATGYGGTGVFGNHSGEGDVDLLVENSSVTTEDIFGYPVLARHNKNGNIAIRVMNSILQAESTDLHSTHRATLSHGIAGYHEGAGDLLVSVLGGRIATSGTNSYGIAAYHLGVGNIAVGTGHGNAIATTGAFGHGIVAYDFGETGTKSIAITVGGNVTVSGPGAQGVRVGTVNAQGLAERVAGMGDDGYHRHSVTIHGPVRVRGANGAGVFLAGGGKVRIWSHGTIAAASGIAVHATGDTPGADPANDPATKPRLYVNLHLVGRRVGQVLGDNWIVNDGGETTIAVNGTVLHDGATGVVVDGNGDPVKAPNGAFDVSIRLDGVTVDTGTDPWTISARSASIVADRDFSAADFDEHSGVRPPPPPRPLPPEPEPEPAPEYEPELEPEQEPEPETEPEPEQEPEPPAIVEEYAPRAAVYEALPGLLLRLDTRGLSDERVASPGLPVWVRLSGGTGSYEPERASVDAQFEFDRFSVEAGVDVPLGENATGSISVRSVRGSGEVVSPGGGGWVEAEGVGTALGVSWSGGKDWYARGRMSLTNYAVDVSSNALGRLKTGVGARAHVLGVEVGKQVTLNEKATLAPRAWATRSGVDVDAFTDAAGARVSVRDAVRFAGGFGVVGEAERDWAGGELSLRGSLGVERIFAGAQTVSEVSGENLRSESPETRILLGLGGSYRLDRFWLGAQVSAVGLGSGDEHYSGRVELGWRF